MEEQKPFLPVPPVLEDNEPLPIVADAAPDPAEEKRRARREKCRSFFAAVGYLGIYLGVQLVITVPYAVLVVMRAVLEYGTDIDAILTAVIATVSDNAILLTAISGAATLFVLWLIFVCRKKRFLREISLNSVRGKPLWPVLLLGLCANLFISGALSFLPKSWLASYSDMSSMLLGDISPLLIAFVVLLAPVVEEVVFRGLIYTRLRRALPHWLALVLAALTFGVMHQHPVWIAYTFLLGLLLCLMLDWYGSLLASIVLHLSFNASSFLEMLLIPVPAAVVLIVSGAAAAFLIYYIRRRTA